MHDKIKGDIDLKIPSWEYNNQRIWGLTAMITADFINICFDGNIPSLINSETLLTDKSKWSAISLCVAIQCVYYPIRFGLSLQKKCGRE